MAPKTYTIAEFAQELKVCEVTVRREIARGVIPHIRVGRAIRIPGTALDKLLDKAS